MNTSDEEPCEGSGRRLSLQSCKLKVHVSARAASLRGASTAGSKPGNTGVGRKTEKRGGFNLILGAQMVSSLSSGLKHKKCLLRVREES